MPASVGLWEGASQLRLRVAMLLDDRLTVLRSCSLRWRWASSFICGVSALALSAVTLQPSHSGPTSATEVFSPLVIGDRFVLCPVTTELQRSLLGSSKQPATDASACVFANFGALEGVELVESSPAFAELSRELARYAMYDDRHLFFRVVVSESRPISDIQKSVEELSRFGELLGKRAGYRKVKRTQSFQGSLDFDWNEYVDRARRLADDSVEILEQAVGDDRVQVYAVSTFLSRLLVQADCVVNILPTVKKDDGRRFPEDFRASMEKLILQLKYERTDEMLCRVRIVDSAEERLRAWIEDVDGRRVFASQFGFKFCNVETSVIGESDEAETEGEKASSAQE